MSSKDKPSKSTSKERSPNKGQPQSRRSKQITPNAAATKRCSPAIQALERQANKRIGQSGSTALKSSSPATSSSNPVSSRKSSQKSADELVKIDEQNLSEMTTTSFPNDRQASKGEEMLEQETDVDGHEDELSTANDDEATDSIRPTPAAGCSSISDPLPAGWEQQSDKMGLYYWHVSTGTIQRNRPTTESGLPRKDSLVFYHDDEEINQSTQKTSSGDDDDDDYYESGAALTLDDTSECTFVVYPVGCCQFDENPLLSAVTNTKAIQKCILRLLNKPSEEESVCWGLDQSQPILMKLFGDHIQFTDIKSRNLLRSQPIRTIKTWAVDDDNNFAFVVEDKAPQSVLMDNSNDSADYTLLNEPVLMCYVFRSDDDDDMSCKVAAKLNEEINRYRELMSDLMSKSTRVQQMTEQIPKPLASNGDETENDEDDLDDDSEASNELTMNVKYIGNTPVPRPTGMEVLNIAIDKCLAEASRNHMNRALMRANEIDQGNEFVSQQSALTEAKLHVSPSSVIVENFNTGEIIVECRIRYLTFMGISKRDIRWCAFIMQNSTNKSFVAHCFECHPTAVNVCEAMQHSCSRMYERVIKSARQPEAMSIIPTGSRIRNTLAKTFSRIKLNPIIYEFIN